ncbi:hypothetical protein ACFSJ3_04060 [Corallincola platygyrae]|uniref:Uncharacterized protein n=1 Tax=Corallincola platygyrae TaxID=1193278 RepID=A0ABW4XJI8_9GAMM
MYTDLLLEQRISLFSKRIAELNSNQEVIITHKNLGRSHRASYPLSALNSKPVEYTNFSWLALIFAILSFSGSGYFLWLQSQGGTNSGAHAALTFFIGLIGVYCVIGIVRSYQSLYVFLNKATGGQAFSLNKRGGGKNAVESFIAELSKRIESIHYPDSLTPQQKQEIYAKHLDFLLAEEVLTADEHSSILNRMLKSSAEQENNLFKLV